MSFLVDYRGDTPPRDPPTRVYARVDHDATAELLAVVLDSVDADWFDEVAPQAPWLAGEEDVDLGWQVSVLVMRAGEAAAIVGDLEGVDDVESVWLEVQLTATVAEGRVEHYLN